MQLVADLGGVPGKIVEDFANTVISRRRSRWQNL